MDLSTTLLQVKALSIDERIRLVQAIWDSISAEPEQLELTEAQQQVEPAYQSARFFDECGDFS